MKNTWKFSHGIRAEGNNLYSIVRQDNLDETNVYYFAGYDFMGGVNLTKNLNEAVLMGLDEAESTFHDLIDAE